MFLQILDMKHIKRDFCSDALVMPKGWDLGAQGVEKNVFRLGHVAYQIDGDDMHNRTQANFSPKG